MPSTPVLGLPYPVSTDTADVPRDMQALALAIEAQGVLPPGVIQMWPGDAAPTGWAILNGTTVPSAANPKLAAIFGESGGNVTLPNFQNRNPVGAQTGVAPIRTSGGVNSGAVDLVRENLPQHKHDLGTGQVAMSSGPPGQAFGLVIGAAPAAGSTNYVTSPFMPSSILTTDNIDPAFTQTPVNARDAYYALNFIIKLG